jgi:hypothetical protein
MLIGGTTRSFAQAIVPTSPPKSQSTAEPKLQKFPAGERPPCALPGLSPQYIQEIVDASSTLQPPLAADAMIRVATKVAAPCAMLAKGLLLRAFDQADRVEQSTSYARVRRNGTPTDTRTSYLSNAYSLQLDRLSLQSRIVIALAPLDGKKAIQLFERIMPPRLSAVGCASSFVPDVSVYYEALGKVLRLRAEKSRSTDQVQSLQELQEIVAATTSPVQLAPLAKVLKQFDLTPPQLSSLISSLSAAINGFPIDDNSIYSDGDYLPVKGEEELVRLAVKSQVSADVLVHSFHVFLDRSLNGPHCAGNEPKNLKDLVEVYAALNRSAAYSKQERELLSIPSSVPPIEPSPDDGEYWLSLKSKALLEDALHLNFDDRGRPFTEADRQTPEWQDRVQHLLNDMEDWRPSDEPDPSDYYHQRCMLLYRTLAYLPPGPLYDRVVATWIATFSESSMQWDSPAEWYFEVLRFLDFSKKRRSGPIPDAALFPLKNTSNPYLPGIARVAEFLQ